MKCPHCGKKINVEAEMGRKGGSVKSEKKAASSAENGKKGGRKPSANKQIIPSNVAEKLNESVRKNGFADSGIFYS